MDINADLISVISRANRVPAEIPHAQTRSNENSFSQKLEKHLNDYEAGEGHLSMSISKDVNSRKFESADILANQNPSAALMYSGYLTAGFGYSNQARFVQQVNTATRATSEITAIA